MQWSTLGLSQPQILGTRMLSASREASRYKTGTLPYGSASWYCYHSSTFQPLQSSLNWLPYVLLQKYRLDTNDLRIANKVFLSSHSTSLSASGMVYHTGLPKRLLSAWLPRCHFLLVSFLTFYMWHLSLIYWFLLYQLTSKDESSSGVHCRLHSHFVFSS